MGNDFDFPHNIPNAWMASDKDSKFFQFAIDRCVLDYRNNNRGHLTSAEETTGPVFLKKAFHEWDKRFPGGILLLPPGIIYGEDWHGIRHNECWKVRDGSGALQECIKYYPGISVLTVWTHSWS